MENHLQYNHPATCFEQALPLGNGSIGAMIYGDYRHERISLNHDTLWSGKPRRITRPAAHSAYVRSRQLVCQGRQAEAEAILERDFSADWSQSYLPLGNLYMSCSAQGEVRNYLRHLNLQTATVTVSYTQGNNRFEREYFVSHPDNCFVLHISSQRPADYIFSADSQLKNTVYASDGRLYLTGECPVSIAPAYARESVPTVYDGTGIHFAAIGTVKTNGHVHCSNDTLSVKNATELTLLLCIETSFAGFDMPPNKPYLLPCETQLQTVTAKPYSEIYNRHVADHCALYDRVQADFGSPSSQEMTDKRLLSESKNDDLGLIELLYNFGRYLIIASSRKGTQATNLQGIWNEQLFAPWSSNYTLNINTQMNYWPVLMNNLAGLDFPIIELTKKLSFTGADVAKHFYNASGYCAHHNTDLWGHASAVGMQSKGCTRYAFWNISAGWLCRHLWEHYEYTLDKSYLRDTAYPLMEGAAKFFLTLLEKDGDYYTLFPTTSPENSYMHPQYGRTALARNCAMTQAIIIDLFANLSHAADILNIQDDLTSQIRAIIPFLNNYRIGSEGQLLEFEEEFVEHDIHHRHLSHLYGLYPGESITLESTPELAQACRISLKRRGDESTGWGMGWRVCLWAKLKDGDHAFKLVQDQLRCIDPATNETSFNGGTYPNLLDAHPPFQIDGNFGVCAGITMFFLQCEDNKLRILPALPTKMRSGSIRGLKAKGNITVDITWRDGCLLHCTLTSAVDCAVTVAIPTGERTVHLKACVPQLLQPSDF